MDDEYVGLEDRVGLSSVPGYRVTQRLPTWSAVVGRARAVREADGLDVQLTALVVTPHPEVDAAARKKSLQSGMVTAAHISRIRHEHLVRVHDVVPLTDEATGLDHVIMATAPAEGGTLSRHLDRVGPLSLGQTITLVVPIGEALRHVHRAGMLHDQLTSEAVVFTADGKPLLGDVGVNRIIGASPTRWPGGQEWAAPEVVEGYESSVESDVYAFAALVWHVLSGDPPTRIGSDVDVDVDEKIADLPEPIRDILQRGLAVDPGARPDVAEIVAEFEAAGGAEPISVVTDHLSDVPARIRAMAARGPVSHRAPPRRLPRVTAVIMTIVLLAAVGLGALVLPGPRSSPAGTTTGDAPAAGSTRHAAPKASRETRTAGATQTARSSDALPGAARTAVTTASSTLPEDILATVLQARADAWQSGDPERLRQAHAADSEALAKDLADLRSATSSGARFRDVEFVARDIQVTEVVPAGSQGLETASQFTATAMVDRSILRVVTDDQTQTVSPSSDFVRLTLRKAPDGWRLWSWDLIGS